MEVVLVRREEVTEGRMEGGSEAGLAWWREMERRWREVESGVEGQEGTWITLVTSWPSSPVSVMVT